MEKVKRTLLLLIIPLTLFSIKSNAQFIVSNFAQNLGGGYYKLTNANNNELGYMWHTTMHNMNDPFTVEGKFNFGSDIGGADGICFIMQDQCAGASGVAAGGGVGYYHMSGNSIAIEFDTYENILGSGDQDNHDPSPDHIAIQKMGIVDHGDAANTIFAPIPMNPLQPNQKDGFWHDFKITYDPSTHLIQVFYDNAPRISYTYNILTNIFGGNPYIYWGFSSSTGGKNNLQQIYIDKSKTTSALKDTAICNASFTVDLPPLVQFNGKNQALNKTVKASSTEYPNPAEAVDGNMSTRWASAWTDNEWFRVDLGSVYDLDSVILFWEGAYGKQYKIQYTSDTNGVWTDAYSETNSDGGTDKVIAPGTNVRYVRMLGIQRGTGYGYSLWEFRIYGSPKYQWSPNDGTISDIYSTNPTFSPTSATTYTVAIPDACIPGLKQSFTATINCPAPITFLSFNVTRANDNTHLVWETTNEVNTSHFLVERSNDGIHFYTLDIVKANNTLGFHTYFSDDASHLEGTTYYRIVEVDIDGSVNYSIIRSITDSGFVFQVLPNPTDGLFYITGYSKEEEEIQLSIIDTPGQLLFSKNLLIKNQFELPIDLSQYATGVYFVTITSNSTSAIKKVLKK